MVWKYLDSPELYHSSYRLEWGSKIAKLLDHAKVPYVAWGDLMNVHMVMHIVTNRALCFVVPDDRLDAAIRALRIAGFPENPCQVSFCDWASPPKNRMPNPWPDHHFHHYQEVKDLVWSGTYTVCYPIGLVRKSQWLWLLPDLPLDFPEPNDPNFMLSTDRRLPDWDMEGFGNSFYPIKLLTPARWIESLFCQEIRDSSLTDDLSEPWHRPVKDFHERLARLLHPELFHVDLIQQPFRTFYKLNTNWRPLSFPLMELLMARLWEEWQKAGSMPNPVFPFDIERHKQNVEKFKQAFPYSDNKLSEILRNGV
ncbi:hypothetical protein AnigIFM63604_003868 [Aspergillus niger]|uniref:Uncharacterized protein n=1 Tax=Aspergillus niger TaxID=5061 RepID=A0A9W5ZY10_ASPNG|nr:hypothetical protein AnigIFM63604_003868 [Aspergillus niger]